MTGPEIPPPRINELWPKALQLPAGEHRLCGCRNSPSWPHCEGGTDQCPRRSQQIQLRKPRFLWMCQCGLSDTMPYCDGEGHIRAERQ